ncbi:MAG TPA: hypothetical protein VJ799_14105 [Nitrososphaeraceae archaeon]|nr:hypothetical protein [Nitrososphaeraceae archaeon]
MGTRMGFLIWIIAIILFLAIIGQGVNTFFSGVKAGIDKLGITPIVETASDDALKAAENASREIIGNSLPMTK